jgi:putative peptidoglycan lipid II flippase
MVKKVLDFLYRPMSGVHDAAYLLAFFTILSQMLGLVRDRMFAANFGAGKVLDLYYASFRIPDFLFVTVASIVSISVLVPLILERSNEKNDLRRFIDSVFNFFLLAIIISAIVAYIFTPQIIKYIFPGFSSGDDFDTLTQLSRIMLLSPIFLGISNFFSSITQAYKRFLVYALSPLLYNLGIILGLVVFYPVYGIKGLGFGVALGALMHLLVQIPFVYSHGLIPRFTFKIDFSLIKKISELSIFRTLALSANQLSILLLLSIGSLMSVGSVAVFNLSWNLQSVPLAIVGASYSMALFPTISRFFSEGKKTEYIAQMREAVRHIIFWSVPITILFVVLRAQIVRSALGAGEFDWSDTRLTAAALAIFSISVAAQSLNLVFTRAFYASGETKKPLWANLVSAVMVVVFALFTHQLLTQSAFLRDFVESLFRVGGISGTEVLALPIGYSLAMILNVVLLWTLFESENKGFGKPIMKSLFQIVSASLIMGFISYVALNTTQSFFDTDTLIGIFSQGLFAGLIGIACGIALMWLLESRELSEVNATLKDKFWRAKVIVPDQESL